MVFMQCILLTFVCQCPERGDPHFYINVADICEIHHGSVNALKGATLISTAVVRASKEANYECVNALKGATLISTVYIQNQYVDTLKCVNALKGATLISTSFEGEKAYNEVVSMP